MTKHLDKGISSIQYNFLNLPKQITQNAQVTNYIYRADGVKVKKLFGDIETNYLDGFQYKALKPSQENPGGLIGPNDVAVMKLRIIPTSEGYFDAITNQYIYNYTDHLGNIRLSYTDTNKDGVIQPRQYFVSECDGNWNPPFEFPTCIDNWKPGEIVEINNYYPFGLMHNYTATTQNAYQYKYQGQELQETGFYSFKWRNYMPDVGRFFNIDPLAEKYTHNSTYAFSENRVIDARELEGLEAVDFRKNDGYKNLVIGVQGYNGNDTKKGATQSQNAGGIDYSGMGALTNLSNSNTRVVIFDSSQNENTKTDIANTITSFNKSHPEGIVAAVGHSLGADNLVETVNDKPQVKVDLLVTLDIADYYDDNKIPSNVSKAVNYYQTNDFPGGEKVESTSGNSSSKIINVKVDSTHRNIDNDMSKTVNNVVNRELTPEKK
ncbi:hypothetical protein AB670_03150 [Chryseobacterium sp. MOF25P]|uniref:RHS repeat-associated core domain-containing protein n=1 Tax=unclassified Chryseobacterium TaxID=2593645 RepID=UPI000805FF27|nr:MULTISPECIES: RHS repeat-associated core domain-containing protein [unclassified Chryseobacterium]OBW40486.1 hypothetical protein AB670_03150 [Chryseobacterium sp. MOF25P]OBW46770.1 hypothetical protein AB671_01121 [Chryseobacterium sp. BGARF1]